MSWVIIGGFDHANFACNTAMTAFGPLHQQWANNKSASDELREFAESLSDDPRELHKNGELRALYREWNKSV